MRTSWVVSVPPLDRLEAVLGNLGTVLDGLGVSWSALGPSWNPLGALLLKMYVFPYEFDDLCSFCRCLRRKLAIRAQVHTWPPSPGPLPRGLRPNSTSSLVPRSFRYLAIRPFPSAHRPPLDTSLEGFAPTQRHHSYLALSVTWVCTERKERLRNLPERAHITLRTGALASRDIYVVVRI